MLQLSQDTGGHESNGTQRIAIRKERKDRRKNGRFHLPVAVEEDEDPELELGDVVEPALVIAADRLEVAVVWPATVLPPAMAELAAPVAPAEAGQLAADGNFTLTLCKGCSQ